MRDLIDPRRRDMRTMRTIAPINWCNIVTKLEE